MTSTNWWLPAAVGVGLGFASHWALGAVGAVGSDPASGPARGSDASASSQTQTPIIAESNASSQTASQVGAALLQAGEEDERAASPAPQQGQQGDAILGGVEGGGTTFVVTIARGSPTNVIKSHEFGTTTPEETLALAKKWLVENNVDAVGIAMFGPIDVDESSPTYGFVTTTPKKVWRSADVRGVFADMSVPIGFNTDVQAAAIGELEYGQHGNISSCCYVTIGTGVGVGVVCNGKPIGALTHPEGGHIFVKKHEMDDYRGCCPYHADCLEGLTCAKAIAERLKTSPLKLGRVSDDNIVWEIVASYLAQLCADLTLLVSPNVIVLGGGVMKRSVLFPLIRVKFKELMNGYVQIDKVMNDVDAYIVPSASEQYGGAGCVGALELARSALLNEQ